MRLSIKDFEEYENKISEEEEKKQNMMKKYKIFNTRQIELLSYFAQHQNDFTTFQRHQRYHHISYITARKDVLELQKKDC